MEKWQGTVEPRTATGAGRKRKVRSESRFRGARCGNHDPWKGPVGKGNIMRFAIVFLMTATSLTAQALSGEAALKKFKQKLESLSRVPRAMVVETTVPTKVCAIPLLQVSAAR